MKIIKIYLYLIFVLSLTTSSACNNEEQLFPQRKIGWENLDEPIKSELEKIILTDHDFDIEVVNFDLTVYEVIYEQKMHGSFSGDNKFKIGEKNYFIKYKYFQPFFFLNNKLYAIERETYPSDTSDLEQVIMHEFILPAATFGEE